MPENNQPINERDPGLFLRSTGKTPRKRLALLAIYFVASMVLILLSPTKGEPLLLLTSWAFYLSGYVYAHVIRAQMAVPIAYLIFAVFFLYLIGLFTLTTFLSRVAKTSLPIIPLLVHGSGAALFLLKTRRVHSYPLAVKDLVGCAIAVMIVVIYFALDWSLARREEQRRM